MFSNPAFDVVIGLVFIFLLYSLLATVLSEIIATFLGLRARNLREAVARMLDDAYTSSASASIPLQLWRSLDIRGKIATNSNAHPFYQQAEIAKQGSNGVFSLPSSFPSGSFSRALLSLMNIVPGITTTAQVDTLISTTFAQAPQTAAYIKRLWEESAGNLQLFSKKLEDWFDKIMGHAQEWYKRKIRIVLLVLGFLMAWIFNANTFFIAKTLSTDKQAREQMVQMATAYIQSHSAVPGVDSTKGLDSLLSMKKELETDIAKANSIMGIGSWPPDEVHVLKDNNGKLIFSPLIDGKGLKHLPTAPGVIRFGFRNKLAYSFGIMGGSFWGFLVTALAVSLGAPFWFDLLNKLVNLRTSPKEPTAAEKNK